MEVDSWVSMQGSLKPPHTHTHIHLLQNVMTCLCNLILLNSICDPYINKTHCQQSKADKYAQCCEITYGYYTGVRLFDYWPRYGADLRGFNRVGVRTRAGRRPT